MPRKAAEEIVAGIDMPTLGKVAFSVKCGSMGGKAFIWSRNDTRLLPRRITKVSQASSFAGLDLARESDGLTGGAAINPHRRAAAAVVARAESSMDERWLGEHPADGALGDGGLLRRDGIHGKPFMTPNVSHAMDTEGSDAVAKNPPRTGSIALPLAAPLLTRQRPTARVVRGPT